MKNTSLEPPDIRLEPMETEHLRRRIAELEKQVVQLETLLKQHGVMPDESGPWYQFPDHTPPVDGEYLVADCDGGEWRTNWNWSEYRFEIDHNAVDSFFVESAA